MYAVKRSWLLIETDLLIQTACKLWNIFNRDINDAVFVLPDASNIESVVDSNL